VAASPTEAGPRVSDLVDELTKQEAELIDGHFGRVILPGIGCHFSPGQVTIIAAKLNYSESLHKILAAL
jgi:hypothetical protein